MSAALFQLNPEQSPQKRWWSNQELAEFYRVSDIMAQAGLEVESESGVSDEGEPWFVFVRSDTGDVIAHFAIIDGTFIAVSSVTQDLYRGTDIRDLINQLVERHPMMTPPASNGKVVLHPSILLTAFVAAAFVAATEEVQAKTIEEVLQAALTINDSERNSATKDTDPEVALENINQQTGKVNNTEIIPTFNDLEAGKTFGSSFALLGAIILALEISSRETALANTQQVNSATNMQILADLHSADYLPVPGLLFSPDPLSITDVNFDDISSLGNDTQFQELITNSLLSSQKNNLTLTADFDNSYLSMQDTKMGYSEKLINLSNIQNDSNAKFTEKSILDDQGFSETSTIDSNIFYNLDTQQNNKISNSEISEQKLSLVTIDIVSLVSSASNSVQQSVNMFPLKLVNNIPIKEDTLNYSLENSFITTFTSNPVEKDSQTPSGNEVAENPASKEGLETSGTIPTSINIKGHLLNTEGPQSLILSSDVDILLYEGGNISVSNFELGKDRVWFFLSEDKKIYDNYKITDSNDLILEFSSGDTLTLLGVLDTESSSLVL